MSLGFTECLLLAGIVFLLFGPNRLPRLGKSVREAIQGFKKGLSGEDQRDVTPHEQIKQSDETLHK